MNEILFKYLGSPYKFHGSSKEEGYDCINLCISLGKDFGVPIPNINHINFTEENYSGLFNTRENQSLWKKVSPKAHTLVVFKINGVVKHVGYMINEFDFIHIMENSKVSIESIDSVQWSRRFVGCYQYIGNEKEI